MGIEVGDKVRLDRHHSDVVGRGFVQMLAVVAMAVHKDLLPFAVVALEVVEFLAVEMHLVVAVVVVVTQQVVEKVHLAKLLAAVAAN